MTPPPGASNRLSTFSTVEVYGEGAISQSYFTLGASVEVSPDVVNLLYLERDYRNRNRNALIHVFFSLLDIYYQHKGVRQASICELTDAVSTGE